MTMHMHAHVEGDHMEKDDSIATFGDKSWSSYKNIYYQLSSSLWCEYVN